jgi:hypothetical protein
VRGSKTCKTLHCQHIQKIALWSFHSTIVREHLRFLIVFCEKQILVLEKIPFGSNVKKSLVQLKIEYSPSRMVMHEPSKLINLQWYNDQ